MSWLLEMLQNKAGLNVRLFTTWRDRTVYEGGKGLQQDFPQCPSAVVAYNPKQFSRKHTSRYNQFCVILDESVVWDI